MQFSLVQLSLHSKLCHVNNELQVVYTCTSMVRVSCTKLPVLRFAWQSLWTVPAKSQCLQMLIANSLGLSRTLTDTAQTPGFTYGSPNLLDKMAFELFWDSSLHPTSIPGREFVFRAKEALWSVHLLGLCIMFRATPMLWLGTRWISLGCMGSVRQCKRDSLPILDLLLLVYVSVKMLLYKAFSGWMDYYYYILGRSYEKEIGPLTQKIGEFVSAFYNNNDIMQCLIEQVIHSWSNSIVLLKEQSVSIAFHALRQGVHHAWLPSQWREETFLTRSVWATISAYSWS